MSLIYKEGQYYGKGGAEMPAEDMAEVASPLPGVMSRLPILFDESGAERVVGWYKYANGTKKPVYEKVVDCGALPNANDKFILTLSDLSIDKLIYANGFAIKVSNSAWYTLPLVNVNSSNNFSISVYTYDGKLSIRTFIDCTGINGWLIIRYIKTTDTPV